MELNVWYAASTPTGIGDSPGKFSKRFLRCSRSPYDSGYGHRQRVAIGPAATVASPAVLGPACAGLRHAGHVAGVCSQCLRIWWSQATLGL